jgi:hypothetical protein
LQVAAAPASWVDDFLSWATPPDAAPGAGAAAALGCCVEVAPPGDAAPAVCPVRWTPALHPGRELPAACRCNSTLDAPSDACRAPPCAVPGGCLAPGLPDSSFKRGGECFLVCSDAFCPRGGEGAFCNASCYAHTPRRSCRAPAAPGAPRALPPSADLARLFPAFLRAECPRDPAGAAACAVCGAHYAADLANWSRADLARRGEPRPPADDAIALDAVRLPPLCEPPPPSLLLPLPVSLLHTHSLPREGGTEVRHSPSERLDTPWDEGSVIANNSIIGNNGVIASNSVIGNNGVIANRRPSLVSPRNVDPLGRARFARPRSKRVPVREGERERGPRRVRDAACPISTG